MSPAAVEHPNHAWVRLFTVGGLGPAVLPDKISDRNRIHHASGESGYRRRRLRAGAVAALGRPCARWLTAQRRNVSASQAFRPDGPSIVACRRTTRSMFPQSTSRLERDKEAGSRSQVASGSGSDRRPRAEQRGPTDRGLRQAPAQKRTARSRATSDGSPRPSSRSSWRARTPRRLGPYRDTKMVAGGLRVRLCPFPGGDW
jgi:hypothetical protein